MRNYKGNKLALVSLLMMAVAVELWVVQGSHRGRIAENSWPHLFIVADTTTDSPGTNLVTRIVTFKAEVGGARPIARQWKVDKGRGFVPVSAAATNPVLVISNALISDTGSYALFATNSAGSTNTKPMPLVVVEGVD